MKHALPGDLAAYSSMYRAAFDYHARYAALPQGDPQAYWHAAMEEASETLHRFNSHPFMMSLLLAVYWGLERVTLADADLPAQPNQP